MASDVKIIATLSPITHFIQIDIVATVEDDILTATWFLMVNGQPGLLLVCIYAKTSIA